MDSSMWLSGISMMLKPTKLIGQLCYKIINVVIYNTKISNV